MSCVKEDVSQPIFEDVSTEIENPSIILKLDKFSLAEGGQSSLAKTRTPVALKDFLGFSYKYESMINHTNNIKFPVVDIDKFRIDYPRYFVTKDLGTTDTKLYSFSSYDRYEEESSSSMYINSELNYGGALFSAGAKFDMSSVYGASSSNSEKNVYGELSILRINKSHAVQAISSVKREMGMKYVHRYFIDHLYNNSMHELVNSYGAFILTDFYTGGKAVALYKGTAIATASTEMREDAMSASISGSFLSSDLDAGFVGNSGSSSSANGSLSQINISVKILGGDLGLSTFSTPTSLDNININLLPWLASLNNQSSHKIIGLNNGGLHSLSDFILEENFKQRINKNLSLGPYSKSITEPFVYIRLEDNNMHSAHLVTRFGDHIRIYNEHLSGEVAVKGV